MYYVSPLRLKFPEVPEHLWEYLFNITINPEDGETKLYFFNSSLDFLYKYSKSTVEKQYTPVRLVPSLYPLSKILGHEINIDTLSVDCFEPNHGLYYLDVEGMSLKPYREFVLNILNRYNLGLEAFLLRVNVLNSTNVSSIEECRERKCLSYIKLGINMKSFKIYCRPFKYNNFNIPENIRPELCAIFNCRENQLRTMLRDGGNAYDFEDNRTLVFTQYSDLKLLRKSW